MGGEGSREEGKGGKWYPHFLGERYASAAPLLSGSAAHARSDARSVCEGTLISLQRRRCSVVCRLTPLLLGAGHVRSRLRRTPILDECIVLWVSPVADPEEGLEGDDRNASPTGIQLIK